MDEEIIKTYEDDSTIQLKNLVTKDKLTIQKMSGGVVIHLSCDGHGSFFGINKKELITFLNKKEK